MCTRIILCIDRIWVYFFWIRKSEFGIRMRCDWCKEEGEICGAYAWPIILLATIFLLLCSNHRASEFRILISKFKSNRLNSSGFTTDSYIWKIFTSKNTRNFKEYKKHEKHSLPHRLTRYWEKENYPECKENQTKFGFHEWWFANTSQAYKKYQNSLILMSLHIICKNKIIFYIFWFQANVILLQACANPCFYI